MASLSTKCKYWEKCFRTDALHKNQFLHPTDMTDDGGGGKGDASKAKGGTICYSKSFLFVTNAAYSCACSSLFLFLPQYIAYTHIGQILCVRSFLDLFQPQRRRTQTKSICQESLLCSLGHLQAVHAHRLRRKLWNMAVMRGLQCPNTQIWSLWELALVTKLTKLKNLVNKLLLHNRRAMKLISTLPAAETMTEDRNTL